MPYRENVPTLDFTGIHLVSICGDNGNGKSAIIDAMTWALWGETRAKRDDDLIHQNANEMEVEFEFAVGEQQLPHHPQTFPSEKERGFRTIVA